MPARPAFTAALALLFSLPVLLPPLYRIIFLSALILAIAALGYNVLYKTGLVSFGHAAYFGLGAYAGGFIYSFTRGGDEFELYLASGVLTAAVVAAAFGFVCVRASRVYFSILTLALAQMVHASFVSGAIFRLFGKGRGFFLLYNGGMYFPRFRMLGQNLPGPLFDTIFSYVVLVIFLASAAVLWRVDNSPFGWALRAIGDNDHRAALIGIPVHRYRWLAFVVSGGFTGLAGALSGQLYQQIAPEHLYWVWSAQLLVVNVLGGNRIFVGPVLGAFLFVMVQEIAIRFTLYRSLVLGSLLVILTLYLPGGVLSSRVATLGRATTADEELLRRSYGRLV